MTDKIYLAILIAFLFVVLISDVRVVNTIDKVKKKDSATGKVTIENVSSPNVTELKLIRAKVQFLDGVVCYLDSEDLYGKELI